MGYLLKRLLVKVKILVWLKVVGFASETQPLIEGNTQILGVHMTQFTGMLSFFLFLFFSFFHLYPHNCVLILGSLIILNYFNSKININLKPNLYPNIENKQLLTQYKSKSKSKSNFLIIAVATISDSLH